MKLYNTLTRQLDELKPLDDSRVSIYTCGPTVYNHLTVGNWVAYLRWDTLVRVLRADGLKPDRVMNITDVGHLVSDADDGEDKLEKGARREGKTAWEVAEIYTKDFLEGMEALNLLAPEHLTKATDYIREQIALVEELEKKGHTYIIDDGVYFDTSTFPTYAEFARLDLDALKAGARVEFNTEKRHPSDFALWKFTPKGEKRDMEWSSPWSPPGDSEGSRKGFPGWHLECSAMALKELGNTLDIHTGGIDHIPVHHTNEIAQSESVTGQRFANIWLHANFLTVDGTKISKSLGNGYTLQDLAKKGFSAMDFRMFVLQSHYRTESNFTWVNLTAARNRLQNWRDVAVLRWQMHDTLVDDDDKDQHDVSAKLLAAPHAILEVLNDDLNTPEALRVIEEAFAAIQANNLVHIQQGAFATFLSFVDDTLGLRLLENTPDIDEESKQLIIERTRARDEKDWQRSDEIRDALLGKGIKLNDTSFGVTWSWK